MSSKKVLLPEHKAVVDSAVRWSNNMLVEVLSNYGRFLSSEQCEGIESAIRSLARYQHSKAREDEMPDVLKYEHTTPVPRHKRGEYCECPMCYGTRKAREDEATQEVPIVAPSYEYAKHTRIPYRSHCVCGLPWLEDLDVCKGQQ